MSAKKLSGKVCISSVGDSLDSLVDPRFGRCSYFLIGDIDDDDFKAIANKGVEVGHGAGISAAQIVADEGVKFILTGNVGPNAFMVLGGAGIKIYTGLTNKTAREALTMLRDGKLTATKESTGPGHSFGSNIGLGRGGQLRGAGRGQGRGLGRGRRQR